MTYTNQEHRDLLAAYAMDAVDDTERAAVRRALEQDLELRDELASYHETLVILAAAYLGRARLIDNIDVTR